MKILYLLPHITNNGGMERIVINKINYLAGRGYSVYLAYYGNKNEKPFFSINDDVELIPIIDIKSMNSFLSKIQIIRKVHHYLSVIIANINPDIVVNANVQIVSWILPFISRNIPKIIELHFSHEGLQIMNKEIYGNNKINIIINDFLRKHFYPLYDKCVLLTEDDKQEWNFKNSIVIPNFTQLYSNIKTTYNQRAIVVGRLEYQKNIDILIKAWRYVKDKYPCWSLDIYGGGSCKEELMKLINILNLDDVVKLKGITSRIQDEYYNHSLFVLPSRYEGFPLVLVEAMNFGLPCIGFCIPGNTTIIQDGFNGRIVKERTPEALADAIIETIKDKNELMRMSKNAVTSIQRFNMDTVMNMWINLFEELKHKKNETYR